MAATITIKYASAVKTPAGFRSVDITATAEKISEKKVRVIEVLDVDGNGSTGYASRTGARRQQYSVGYKASGEIGKNKILSACKIV